MARLGKAKMQRWERDLAKAQAIVQKVLDEAIAVQHDAKGGRWQYVTGMIASVRGVQPAIRDSIVAIKELADSEARKAVR